MKDPLLQTVKQFLRAHHNPHAPVLLGFSGGPDSLCLLHALLACKGVDLHLAHVDHGWREESKREAALLAAQAQQLGVPFHLHELNRPKGRNLEDRARKERLSFFASVSQTIGAQALVLAHQADDQSETVLKRLFEGASLPAMGGLRPLTSLDGMVVWRPLLRVSKKEIYAWLRTKGLIPLEDPTNRDPQFLRSRMRESLIPLLSASFGKEIGRNLVRLGDSAQELSLYLEEKMAPYRQQSVQNSLGVQVDFRPLYPVHPVELMVFLKQLTKGFSHEQLLRMRECIEKKIAYKTFVCKEGQVVIDRGQLFLSPLKNMKNMV